MLNTGLGNSKVTGRSLHRFWYRARIWLSEPTIVIGLILSIFFAYLILSPVLLMLFDSITIIFYACTLTTKKSSFCLELVKSFNQDLTFSFNFAQKGEIMGRIIGYLRVSTAEQDLEKNKADILKLATERELGHVEWVEEKVSGVKNWKKVYLEGFFQN